MHAIDAFKDRELEFEPGTQYVYSSFGYTVLGAIIEKVSKMSYGEYMRKNIWDKAGMSNTSLEVNNQNSYQLSRDLANLTLEK